MKRRSEKPISKDERGFTLIELLAVLIIIGILAGIAIPSIAIPMFFGQRGRAKRR